MKFALYQPWIYLHGGLERTVLELARRSRHDWVIYTGHYSPSGTFPGFAQLDVRTLGPTSIDRGVGSVLKSALQVALQKLPLDPDVDALVVCCDGIGDLITFRNRSVPNFNLCFTPLRAAFDPVYEKKAISSRGLGERLVYYTMKYGFRLVDRIAWSRYRNVIAISQEVKNRIVAGKLYPEKRISLAYPGIDWPVEIGDVTHEPFVLVAGRIMWTKNIELAIRAFLAADPPSPWRLVIAGYLDAKSQVYFNALRSLANGDKRIEFVISPSDDEMSALYRTASFCLFTPLNEDWGIAPLEAMCRAKPVIAVNSGGPRETIVDGHSGCLLPPMAVEWSQVMKARADVRRFTWDEFVPKVDDLLESWVLEIARAGGDSRQAPGDHRGRDGLMAPVAASPPRGRRISRED